MTDKPKKGRVVDDLDLIAIQVERLSPAHGDPERFYLAREACVEALRQVIARMQGR